MGSLARFYTENCIDQIIYSALTLIDRTFFLTCPEYLRPLVWLIPESWWSRGTPGWSSKLPRTFLHTFLTSAICSPAKRWDGELCGFQINWENGHDSTTVWGHLRSTSRCSGPTQFNVLDPSRNRLSWRCCTWDSGDQTALLLLDTSWPTHAQSLQTREGELIQASFHSRAVRTIELRSSEESKRGSAKGIDNRSIFESNLEAVASLTPLSTPMYHCKHLGTSSPAPLN